MKQRLSRMKQRRPHLKQRCPHMKQLGFHIWNKGFQVWNKDGHIWNRGVLMKQIGPNCFIYGHMKQRRRHLTDFNNSSPKYSIQIVYFKARSTLIRFQTKTELICVHTYRFRIVSPVHTTTPYPFWKRFYTLKNVKRGPTQIGIVFVCRLLLVYICKVEQGSAGERIIFNVLHYSSEIDSDELVVCSLNGLFQKKSTPRRMACWTFSREGG